MFKVTIGNGKHLGVEGKQFVFIKTPSSTNYISNVLFVTELS